MSAAHAARERGACVLVLEKADPEWSGGNSAFTAGAIRIAHGGLAELRDILEGIDDELAGRTDLEPYTADAFAPDMRRGPPPPRPPPPAPPPGGAGGGGGGGGEPMARILVEDSGPAVRWLHERG